MHIHKEKYRNLAHRYSWVLMALVGVATLTMHPTIVESSSWSPTLLVNTEAFQVIDDGDGSSDIELRFGTSGKELRWNVTDSQFEFDAGIEVHGTASGNIIHAQDTLTSSGGLVWEGAASGASLFVSNGFAGSGLEDCDAAGDTLNWDATTQRFSCGTDADSGSPSAGQGITVAGSVISLTAVHSGTTIEATTLLSGATVHAQDLLTSSGQLIVESNATFGDSLYILEQAEADADKAGYGQIWVNTATPNELYFTTDDGDDRELTYAGGAFHDGFSDFVGNEHIDHTAVTLTAGVGLSGGGDISANRTFTFDATELDAITWSDSANATNVWTFDVSGTDHTMTFGSALVTFSDDVDVSGTLSGTIVHAQDSLSSSGALSIEGGVTFASITSCTLLETDANGVLSCASSTLNESVDDRVNDLLQAGSGISLSYDDTNNTLTVKNTMSSGADIFMSPDYPNSIYFGSGSSNVGQLSLSGSIVDGENYYHWISTKSTIQNYWISTRVRIPDNFSKWEETNPIELRYRTGSGLAVTNFLTLGLLDTAGTIVSLTGGSSLANTSWTTATITGPESAGTFTPGSYITLLLNLAGMTPADTTDRGYARASYMNLNWLMK